MEGLGKVPLALQFSHVNTVCCHVMGHVTKDQRCKRCLGNGSPDSIDRCVGGLGRKGLAVASVAWLESARVRLMPKVLLEGHLLLHVLGFRHCHVVPALTLPFPGGERGWREAGRESICLVKDGA